MKVLFDESVRIDGILGEYSLADVVFGRETDFKAKTKKTECQQKEIDCLDTIAGLCREKRIVPYTTDELHAEYFRGATFPSRNYKYVFKDINFEMAPCPIKRSKFGISLEQYTVKKEVIHFCSVLLRLSHAGIEKYISDMRKNPVRGLSPFEEKCLRNLNVYREICHGIDEKHYPDALHLWTAEENGMDVFLTMDKKFRNVMDRQKVNLNCSIMFPSELIKRCK